MLWLGSLADDNMIVYAERLLAQTDFAPDSFVISPSSERDMEKNPLPWDLDIKPSAPEPQGQSSLHLFSTRGEFR
jgi:hypothetical protein